jgi:signal transduction histidine kinase
MPDLLPTTRQGPAANFEEAREALTELTSAIAHDVLGPVNLLVRLSSLLVQSAPPGAVDADLLEHINSTSARLQLIGQGLREYFQLLSTEGIERREVDSADLLRDVVEYLRSSGTVAGLGVQGEGLPAIQGDPKYLFALFSHLVTNAHKFRSAKDANLRVWAEPAAAGWTFCFADNGMGLDPERTGRLFKPLARLCSETHAGAGLGLAICRRIVELHGGRIWLESAALGKGAQFRFTLPE